jgi:flagellar L-ring protein precursor FlgH
MKFEKVWLLCIVGMTAACNGELSYLGKPPPLNPPGAVDDGIQMPTSDRINLPTRNPTYQNQVQNNTITSQQLDAQPVAYTPQADLMPRNNTQAASLWASGPTSLFGDRRAQSIGDIMTVVIDIEDEAAISNTTNRSRSGDGTVTIGNVFGVDTLLQRILPGDATLDPAVTANATSSTNGTGTVSRDETISLRIAATVMDVLPNGHLVIAGNQEVRVNFERRDLQVAGIVRPEDISRKNEITYDKMADARIIYGGRGHISDMQQPRIGQQIVDIVSPF